jgi:hypothetical protein
VCAAGVAVVVIATDGGVFDGAIHTFDLAVGPGMVWLGQPVFNSMAFTDAIERAPPEHGRRPLSVLRQIGELDAVIGEHGVYVVGNCLDKGFEEGRASAHVRTLD